MRHADEILTGFGVAARMPRRVGAPDAGVDGRLRGAGGGARPRGDHRGRRRRRAPAGHGRGAHGPAGDRRAGPERRAQRARFAAVHRADAEGRARRHGRDRRGGRVNAGLLAVAILATSRPALAREAAGLPRRDGRVGRREPSSRERFPAHPPRLDDRRARRRPAGPHVRDGRAPPRIPRAHARARTRHARPARSPTSRSRRRTTISIGSASSRAASTSSRSSSRTSRPRPLPRPRSTRSSVRTVARCSIAQHRLREKTFLAERGLPVTPFAPVAIRGRSRGGRCGRRPARGAEDGRVRLRRQGPGRASTPGDDPLRAWETLGRQEAILEAFIDLEREISVVGARGVDGAFSSFGPIENVHRHHILDVSVAPSTCPRRLAARGRGGDPRRDGSARLHRHPLHRVLRGARRTAAHQRARAASAQLRAPDVRRLPHEPVRAAAPRDLRPAARVARTCCSRRPWPTCSAICGRTASRTGRRRWPDRNVKLHLYGKAQARPGRKMGHLTVLGSSADEARTKVLAARSRL